MWPAVMQAAAGRRAARHCRCQRHPGCRQDGPARGNFSLCVSVQSDPEFVQWKKELTETFTEAQRLLRRAPKFLNKSRSSVVELSKPPLCHRNSNGL